MAVIIHNHVQVQARGHVSAPIVRDHRDDRAPVRVERPVREVRVERPVIVRPVVYAPVYSAWTPAPSYTYQPSVIQVLAPTALANDQLAIDTGSLGNATTLELDAAGGSTYVSQVVVYSANGAAQVIPVNQMLSPQNPSIPLSIDQCNAVSRIVVDGHSEWGGAISIRAL
jgi:hypothetical protein